MGCAPWIIEARLSSTRTRVQYDVASKGEPEHAVEPAKRPSLALVVGVRDRARPGSARPHDAVDVDLTGEPGERRRQDLEKGERHQRRCDELAEGGRPEARHSVGVAGPGGTNRVDREAGGVD